MFECYTPATFGRVTQHFGPNHTHGWAPRPMSLVADYTYRIRSLHVDAGQEFMFVQKLPEPRTYTPPLGELNFKQGKIGVGRGGELYPGGQAGRFSASGLYDITVDTASMTILLELHPEQCRPGVTVLGSRGVTDQPDVELTIVFTHPVSYMQQCRFPGSVVSWVL